MAPPVPLFRTLMYAAWPFVRRWLTLYLLEAAAEHMPDVGDYWPSSESEDDTAKPEAAPSDRIPLPAESSSEAAPAEGDEAVEVCLQLVTGCFTETESSENGASDLIPWLLLLVLLLLLCYGLHCLSSTGRHEPGPSAADAGQEQGVPVADAAGAPPRTPEWKRKRGVADAASSPRRATRRISMRLRVEDAAGCARLAAAADGNLPGLKRGLADLEDRTGDRVEVIPKGAPDASSSPRLVRVDDAAGCAAATAGNLPGLNHGLVDLEDRTGERVVAVPRGAPDAASSPRRAIRRSSGRLRVEDAAGCARLAAASAGNLPGLKRGLADRTGERVEAVPEGVSSDFTLTADDLYVMPSPKLKVNQTEG